MPRTLLTTVLALLLGLAATLPAMAASAEETDRDTGETTGLSSLPSPGKLFSLLDDVGRMGLADLLTSEPVEHKSEAARALDLGKNVMDGFLALHAQDPVTFAVTALKLRKLLEDFELTGQVAEHLDLIAELAGSGSWKELPAVLTTIHTIFLREMEAEGALDRAALAFAGSYLELLRTLLNTVAAKYTEKAEMTRFIPEIMTFVEGTFLLVSKYADMDDPVIQELAKRLPELRDMAQPGEDGLIKEENLLKATALIREFFDFAFSNSGGD